MKFGSSAILILTIWWHLYRQRSCVYLVVQYTTWSPRNRVFSTDHYTHFPFSKFRYVSTYYSVNMKYLLFDKSNALQYCWYVKNWIWKCHNTVLYPTYLFVYTFKMDILITLKVFNRIHTFTWIEWVCLMSKTPKIPKDLHNQRHRAVLKMIKSYRYFY